MVFVIERKVVIPKTFFEGGGCQSNIKLVWNGLVFMGHFGLIDDISVSTLTLKGAYSPLSCTITGEVWFPGTQNFGIMLCYNIFHVWSCSVGHFYCILVENLIQWVPFWKVETQNSKEILSNFSFDIH